MTARRRRERGRGHDEEAASRFGPDPELKALTDRIASSEPLDAPSVQTLQRTAGNQAVMRLDPRMLQRALGAGEPLDARTRSRMESAFGTSFAGVRTHTGPESTRVVQRENAAAFAVGEHIVFGDGAFKPGTLEGDVLLAHELAHVAQQRDAQTAVQAKSLGDVADSALERDADRSAFAAVASLWGGARQNAMPALKSGVRLSKGGGCGGGKSNKRPDLPSAGGTKSDQIKVSIDSAVRPMSMSGGQNPNLVVKGSVEGVSNGIAELYRVEEVSEGNCSEANAVPPDPVWGGPIVNGKFEIMMPYMTQLTPGTGRWIMVKAGDGTNYNLACKQVSEK